jgi:hypothetical protein
MAQNLNPSPLYAVYTQIKPYLKSREVSGVVGNAAHVRKGSYHVSRDLMREKGHGSHYSMRLDEDLEGGDGRYASAIDIKLNPSEMKTATNRLIEACRSNDPRMFPIREIIGTVDGRNVCGYNRKRTGTSGSRSKVGLHKSGYSDASHLWHIHISVLRRYVLDKNRMTGLAEVLCGLPAGALGWKDPDVIAPPKPPPPKPPARKPLDGSDVSKYQPDWKPAKGDSFVFVRAARGMTVDPLHGVHVDKARAAGLVVGHYLYLLHGKISDQVEKFCDRPAIQNGDLLVIDWEADGVTNAEKDTAIKLAQALRPQCKVGLYCNQNHWLNIDKTDFRGDFLWIARYGGEKPTIRAPYKFWQYSTTGNTLDRNYGYFDSAAELRKWARGKVSP